MGGLGGSVTRPPGRRREGCRSREIELDAHSAVGSLTPQRVREKTSGRRDLERPHIRASGGNQRRRVDVCVKLLSRSRSPRARVATILGDPILGAVLVPMIVLETKAALDARQKPE